MAYENPRIIEILRALKARFLDEVDASSALSLFLCGGSDPTSMAIRNEVGQRLSRSPSKYRYKVYYPEDMFIELLLGHHSQNLLGLENLLAGSVNAVAILLHSPGTFTELGAFANHSELRNKLIVIIDPKYKRAKSFINLGPIRLLKTRTKSQILYLSMDRVNTSVIASRLASCLREIVKHSVPIRDFTNPILVYEYYLALIYTFDPADENHISESVRLFGGPKQDLASAAAATVVNSLINEGKVMRSYGKLATTPRGADILLCRNRTRRSSIETSAFLTQLRLQAMNLTLRRIRTKKVDQAR